ncbi:hypothetical protein PF005_g14522 [Phytophthora fragariae]|uniref:BED-type domain-containing protein n=1 Tax=Phytophthora fragariae TaxID=53985 RepID=A0A6A3U7E8_9STRA|nr:hypothetical protein PF003_g1682 [Phytophthora fragariae]KAE8940113.1 hypothetical protein PF009_g10060 [Phytophthora fragariae]KAE9013749.1 hypothetical protein PF011_g8339 [Phytophthora fragariae]KAE9117001.1 hypothetical protein PF010_g8746 [Phytophthora fragariae]KAE9118066.1 hypothetical protein PF007_g9073 [Phytophthora fragariae]
MALTISFTNKQVCDFFFKPVFDYQDEPTAYFCCRFSKLRKQDSKTGYTNLMSHISAQHPIFAAEMASSGLDSGTLVGFVDKKSQTLYS